MMSSNDNNNNNNNNNSKSPPLLLPLPVVKKYKAFHTGGRFDSRRGVYEYCDLFELHTVRHPLHVRNFLYYQEHPTEKPAIVLVGDDNRITQKQEPQYYSASFSSSESNKTDSYPYTIVIARLYARRFYNVSKFDLEQWAIESREEENTIFIDQPIAGIAICREVLEATRELSLLHVCVAASDPQLQGKHDFERENFTISYDAIPCNFLDCSKCYREIELLNEPQLFTLGKSRYDPVVVATNKERAQRRKKVRQLKMWRDMTAILSASLEITSALDEMSDLDDDALAAAAGHGGDGGDGDVSDDGDDI